MSLQIPNSIKDLLLAIYCSSENISILSNSEIINSKEIENIYEIADKIAMYAFDISEYAQQLKSLSLNLDVILNEDENEKN